MKIQVLQENLQRGLGIVGRAVATRSTLPITSNVLLESDRGRLKLAATDLDITICAWVGAKVDEEGATTIPSRLLTDFVGSLPPGIVNLELPGRSRTVSLECGQLKASVNSMDAEDFPRTEFKAGSLSIPLDPRVLRRTIELVEFAAAADDSRPVLTGIHVKSDGEKLKFAAADGFRLAVATIHLQEPPPEPIELVVPARAMRELGRLIADGGEPVQLHLDRDRTRVQFTMTDVELVAQLIQGQFPNYQQLIPQSSTTTCTVNLEEFQRDARIAAIFARDGSGIIRLQLQPGEGLPGRLTVSARADEVGQNEGNLDAEITGEANKIAFNSRYLQDVLNALASEQVKLEMSSPSSQGVFRPSDETDYVHVVMPMFVQW